MDSAIVHAIVGALGVGALEGAKDTAKKAVAEGYDKLRSLLTNRFGSKGRVEAALTSLEENPESSARQAVLNEELTASGASSDPALFAQASTLLELVKKLQPEDSGSQVAYGTGIAQADRHSSASVTIHNEQE
jgi:hypothetical protein